MTLGGQVHGLSHALGTHLERRVPFVVPEVASLQGHSLPRHHPLLARHTLFLLDSQEEPFATDWLDLSGLQMPGLFHGLHFLPKKGDD